MKKKKEKKRENRGEWVLCVGYDLCFLDYHVRTQSIIIMERN